MCPVPCPLLRWRWNYSTCNSQLHLPVSEKTGFVPQEHFLCQWTAYCIDITVFNTANWKWCYRHFRIMHHENSASLINLVLAYRHHHLPLATCDVLGNFMLFNLHLLLSVGTKLFFFHTRTQRKKSVAVHSYDRWSFYFHYTFMRWAY